MNVNGVLTEFVSWNGYFYGIKENKNYYKSKNVRFDNICGSTEECTEKEYLNVAKKYMEIMN